VTSYEDRLTIGTMLALCALYVLFAGVRALRGLWVRRLRPGDAGHTEATLYASMLGVGRVVGFSSKRALKALRCAKPHPLRQERPDVV
jgi:hypothetical protein